MRGRKNENMERDYQVASSWHSWWRCHRVAFAKTVQKSFDKESEKERERSRTMDEM